MSQPPPAVTPHTTREHLQGTLLASPRRTDGPVIPLFSMSSQVFAEELITLEESERVVAFFNSAAKDFSHITEWCKFVRYSDGNIALQYREIDKAAGDDNGEKGIVDVKYLETLTRPLGSYHGIEVYSREVHQRAELGGVKDVALLWRKSYLFVDELGFRFDVERVWEGPSLTEAKFRPFITLLRIVLICGAESYGKVMENSVLYEEVMSRLARKMRRILDAVRPNGNIFE